MTSPDILEERAKCNFDKKDLAHGLLGEDILSTFEMGKRFIEKDAQGFGTPWDYYEMSAKER